MLNIDSHHYIHFTPESHQLKSGDIYCGEMWAKYEYKFYNIFQLHFPTQCDIGNSAHRRIF